MILMRAVSSPPKKYYLHFLFIMNGHFGVVSQYVDEMNWKWQISHQREKNHKNHDVQDPISNKSRDPISKFLDVWPYYIFHLYVDGASHKIHNHFMYL